ncbi:hypothetical protein ACQCN2_01300 [Brevibacillus ginsengisoli]|uniref:hypothetical protein n=1 Tax=Brevibacillus ginsengisoli TaxID=363854 RepID=UPI003CED6125
MSLIVFLWWMSGILSLLVLFFAIIAQSWVWTLISGVLFLPIAYYFGGAKNSFQLIGLIPLIHLALACLFLCRKKHM